MPAQTAFDALLLDEWLAEFRALDYFTRGYVRVVENDDDTGTGLIVVDLSGARTITYLQPVIDGEGCWKATMEARDDTIELGAAALATLGDELRALGALVAFLETKSKALLAAS